MSTENLAPAAPKKRNFFSAPPAKPRLSDTEIAKKYPQLRRQVFMGIFLGYAAFYLIRNNISLVGPLLGEALNYDKVAVGIIANAVLISYGLSKFFMATLSDRSNARYFLPLGLALSAFTNLLIALAPWATASLGIFATVMFLNGWFQGMGWPPSGRSLVHWFSTSERGIMTAVWNCAHNVGGFFVGMIAAWGLQITGDQWQSAFWANALVALVVAVVAFLMIRDTPESEGLPPIEEYRNDPAKVEAVDEELKSLSYWTIIFRHVLTDRVVVLLAVCNIFVYSMRYGVLNWIPFYLEEKHHLQLASGIAGFSLYELSGIAGTLLCGIVADKVFKGWRSGAGLLFLGLTGVFIVIYWLLPVGTNFYVLMAVISCIGALIYGPVMLIGLQAIDLSPRNVAGTAAGFTGLFGYLLGATIASSGMGVIAHQLGWNAYFIVLIVVSVLAVLLMLVIGKSERQLMNAHQKKYSKE
ncbi:MFS transporter [Mobiluncus mulieris]|uniref:Glycerol-3-phosphate transporter n=2 Tax=Mobiluncus mulieris TaxID=2052 RepID=E0QQ62_9ACTO|nr:MFS transporter [Mobiluncus mulieris]EEJ54819.1 putative glycerol-3-phosphate transporter [Mobiluncus mulieris ATCC 35243]EFM46442.1 putative glycerol-3-phosphate transporter [Mobiluncus mulieris ATCC 35239]MCU9970448.1 MFS transporter [Mobiluncus mulieris]MCU9975386.1 MFS transporter [Mobiluncus mulieris]MCU9993153.1 MFS transporter [Mobiluncus mulieris]